MSNTVKIAMAIVGAVIALAGIAAAAYYIVQRFFKHDDCCDEDFFECECCDIDELDDFDEADLLDSDLDEIIDDEE